MALKRSPYSFLESFYKSTRPIEPESPMHFILLKNPYVLGGGESKKFGNILLNWKKLLIANSEGALTIIGAISFPCLIPLAALVVWSRVYPLVKVKLNQKHAIVILALWNIRNPTNDIVAKE